MPELHELLFPETVAQAVTRAKNSCVFSWQQTDGSLIFDAIECLKQTTLEQKWVGKIDDIWTIWIFKDLTLSV